MTDLRFQCLITVMLVQYIILEALRLLLGSHGIEPFARPQADDYIMLEEKGEL